MTTFKEIRGKLIKTVASDPTPVANYEGEIWYNTTTGQLKAGQPESVAGAWAASNPVLTHVSNYGAGGTQTAAFIAGGSLRPPNAITNITQDYDGNSWTAGNNMLTTFSNRANGGFGTQTAGAIAGGYGGSPATPRNVTEEYDGTSWTTGGTLNQARWRGEAGGTQTAGLFHGGNDGSPAPVNCTTTEEYNGTSWTSVTGSSVARRYHSGFGNVQTSIVVVGGYKNPGSTAAADVEHYDGTNWTTGTSYPTTIHSQQGFGESITAGVICGGTEPGGTATLTKSYDGSAWTAQGALANPYSGVSAVGTSSAGVIGSSVTVGITASEEYTGPFQQVATKTLTTS